MKNLDGIWNRKCHACTDLKPARTFHCSICNTCVFQMQHHCVFTNNCVGLENHRFFFLFIFYLTLGVGYYALSIFAVWHRFVYNYLDHQRLSLLLLMDCMLFFALVFFHLWQWLLATLGLTNVEFMLSMAGYRTQNYEFSFQRVRDNLFKIFGTRNIVRMFSPSLRLNPFTGLEWSFQMKELGFDEFGGLEDDESQRLVRKKKRPQTIEMQENPYEKDGDEEVKDMEIAV
uniref:Palmitoyltransferase n=1 Tax=Strombidium inclinatum TaxID=197538 RepID=A0A7S3MV71_9SPIT|mmetsp:Transcript_24736/g.38510  ORF Transcript_24736/g.38510 Transcript_24736/m.38510 type:complete len:230 (+) Transcript_24736:391-1080(+)